MPESEMNTLLAEYLWKQSHLPVFFVSKDGYIQKASTGAKNQLNSQPEKKHIQELLVEFSPQIDISTAVHSESPQLFNFRGNDDMPQSWFLRFFQTDEGYLIIGENDPDETSTLRKSIIQANNDFANLNRQLQKNNAELERLNKLKNRFLGMAAHDLRNPVASIYSLSEFLLAQSAIADKPDEAELIRLIQSSGEFMLSLLEELLSIARIEAGKIDLTLKPTRYCEFIGHCVEINRILAKRRNITLSLNCCTEIPEISIDTQKIEQVINNLLGNAIKYSPDGAHIAVNVFHDDTAMITSVEDAGKGIKQKEIQKLFTPFYSSTSKPYTNEKSTGLGLFICQQIILGHQGRIWVDSTEGKGSIFTFSLPFQNSITIEKEKA